MKQPKPHTNHNHINPLSSSSPKNPRTDPRTSALNLSEWEEKRYIISALYRHYTLQETRNIMSKKYGCFHSEKLFKEKLNEWGLCKYMPISTAIWILNHEKWVRDRGNAVVYVFSGLRVSMGEIRRKIRRARVKIRIGECGGFDPTAPPNLEYMITGAENWDSSQDRITYTAFNSSSCDGSVHSDDSIDTLDNYISSEEFEPQSQIWTSPKRYNPTTPNANLAPKTWNNKCAQEILETYHEGIDIWHRTRHSEPSIQHLGTQTASLKFHEALFGFNYLHSPNDLKTRGAAYHLAECYAHLGQKEYFIAVLDWLGRELVRCGNRADETNAHIVKVMELFRVGGTPREAVGLLFTSLGE